MARIVRHPPLQQAQPVPSGCSKCGNSEISGPHFSLIRRESKTGRSHALAQLVLPAVLGVLRGDL
jgi:hypothetical protein